jgi:hypothetical protein
MRVKINLYVTSLMLSLELRHKKHRKDRKTTSAESYSWFIVHGNLTSLFTIITPYKINSLHKLTMIDLLYVERTIAIL